LLLALVAVDVHCHIDADNNANDDQYDQYNEEANPSLLTSGNCRLEGFVGVSKARIQIEVRWYESKNQKTYPVSVSFSTPAAAVWMVSMVSSCCSTSTLIWRSRQ
jgi:hypothetical protein